MDNLNVEHLENLISAYINNLYKDVPPTEEEFANTAECFRNNMKNLMPVTDQEFQQILSRLRQNIVIQMDVGTYINDRNNGHQSWLTSKRVDFDFFFWNRYKKYLEEVQPDPEIRHMLQCLMGLSLIPDTSRNVIFFLYGEGGCGKSVFIEVLRNLVGVENCCCVPLARFTDRFRCIDLTKSLLNIIGDMPTDDGTTAPHNIEGMMKDAADGGSIPVEEKFKTPYTAKVTARSIFATNSLPHFTDRTQALQDRLRIIPFTQRCLHQEPCGANEGGLCLQV